MVPFDSHSSEACIEEKAFSLQNKPLLFAGLLSASDSRPHSNPQASSLPAFSYFLPNSKAFPANKMKQNKEKNAHSRENLFQYDVYICTTVLMKRNQIQVSLFLTCSNSLLDLLSTVIFVWGAFSCVFVFAFFFSCLGD